MTEPSRPAFKTAVVFWSPDVVREERLNVGIFLISPALKFCGARFVGEPEIQRIGELLGLEDMTAAVMDLLTDYRVLATEPRETNGQPLRYNHPHIFHALLGQPNPFATIQWRPAMSGVLRNSAEDELEYWFHRVVLGTKENR